MNIKITAHSIDLTDNIKAMIQEKFIDKLDKLLINYDNDLKSSDLIIEKNKYKKYIVKFDISLPGKDGYIFSQNEHEDLTAAITGLREQIEKQIKKYKADQVNYSLG